MGIKEELARLQQERAEQISGVDPRIVEIRDMKRDFRLSFRYDPEFLLLAESALFEIAEDLIPLNPTFEMNIETMRTFMDIDHGMVVYAWGNPSSSTSFSTLWIEPEFDTYSFRLHVGEDIFPPIPNLTRAEMLDRSILETTVATALHYGAFSAQHS